MSADNLTVGEYREHLRRIAEETRARQAETREGMEAREWAAVPMPHKVIALMLAGVDGDLDALADRPWRAVPPPEREAIRGAMRDAMLAYRGMVAVHGLPRACR